MFIKDVVCEQLFTVLPRFFPERQSSPQDEIGITMLLCHNDVVMATYALESLFYQLKYSLPVFIIDDGTLTVTDKKTLTSLFTVQFMSKEKALSESKQAVKKYPWFSKYLADEKVTIKKLKLALLFLAPFKNLVSIEPDHLFFNAPTEIPAFQKGTKNYFTVLPQSVYEVSVRDNIMETHFRRMLLKHLHIEVPFLFNGGILFVKKNRVNDAWLKKADQVIQLFYDVDYARMTYSDETLMATLFEKQDSIQLKEKYLNLVFPNQYKKSLFQTAVSIHFTSGNRLLYKYQAIKLFIFTKAFAKVSN